jgi:hypothetical protein
MGRIPLPEELLFFDLETTGLSGGAGTIAFLAAFGRFAPPGIRLTQYLLLDYPGEEDFLRALSEEFASFRENGALPIAVSYNGKSFDSQILRNRCLMHGMPYPEYLHADLLHPARRLWKRLLPDCSQSTIEVSILGLDRTGDIPGALAPDIWFSFLRNGGEGLEGLMSISDHNVRDIAGLAALFLAMTGIALDPMKSRNRLRFDEEALALYWRKAAKKDTLRDDEKETGELLLEAAARNGFTRAAYALALDCLRGGKAPEGRALMARLAEGSLRAAALASLAIDAEWRLADPALALRYTNSALNVPEVRGSLRKKLEKRRERLESKRSLYG